MARKAKQGQKQQYRMTINFTADRPLTEDEIDQMIGQAEVQVQEPQDAEGDDAAWESRYVETSLVPIEAPRYKEHPDIEVPAFLQGEGWHDVSWHNDAMARSERELPDGRLLAVWVNYDDPDEREVGDKFAVVLADDEEGIITADKHEILYEGDDEDKAAQAVAAAMMGRR